LADLLVRLYDLPHFEAEARVAAAGIVVRRAMSPERYVVLDFVRDNFYPGWVGEAALGMSQMPITVWVAVKDGKLLGFACHDTTAKGFFGPTGRRRKRAPAGDRGGAAARDAQGDA
jgi:hypothetical protein